MNEIPQQVYYKVFRGWHVLWCATNPGVFVADPVWSSAKMRAEAIFGVEIRQPEPEAA